jgi:hypothetical protein
MSGLEAERQKVASCGPPSFGSATDGEFRAPPASNLTTSAVDPFLTVGRLDQCLPRPSFSAMKPLRDKPARAWPERT